MSSLTFGCVALLGCSDDCPTLELCDIRAATCQTHVAEVVACQRGGTPETPPVDVVNATTFVNEQIANPPVTSDDERDYQRGLSLLGLAPANPEDPALTRAYWDTVGAFYSEDTGRITVLDRGNALSSARMVGLLTHEIVHAMQHDALAGTSARLDTYDSQIAWSGVVEGEAVLYEDLALLHGFGRDPSDVDFEAVFATYQSTELDDGKGDASPYQFASRRFPYAFGGAYVNRAWRAGGNAGVAALFRQPPQTTREILASDGFVPPGSPWAEPPDEVGVPDLGPDHSVFVVRHLGLWTVEAFRRYSAADLGYVGDVFTASRTAAGDVTASWRLRFDTAGAANRFAADYQQLITVRVSVIDRDVAFLGSTVPGLIDSIGADLSWLPSPAVDTSFASAAPAAPRLVCTVH